MQAAPLPAAAANQSPHCSSHATAAPSARADMHGRTYSTPASPHLCQERHEAGAEGGAGAAGSAGPAGLVSKWRQKEKLKTTAVALVLCLNIGVDPPDVIKISPCARLECWVDPLSMQPAKALETIGALQLAMCSVCGGWSGVGAGAWVLDR